MLKLIIAYFPISGLILLPVLFLDVCGQKYAIDPEVELNLEQRIKRHGYPVEYYQVFTKDGYINPVFRVPHGLKEANNDSKNKSVVMLVHGMGGSPQNFVILGSKKSLPYYFADRGFDVWLFTARGVDGPFKKKHAKYDWNKDKEYWLFSFHEISVYDLTAAIDFVLNHTGQKKLSLIGHSAAGNEFFCMFSERPEYNQKVNVAISWASSPILKNTDYPLAIFFSALNHLWRGLFKYLDMTEFLPMLQELKPMLKVMCADPEWNKICIMSTWIIGSHKSVIQDLDDIQVIVSNIPRMANKQIYHFMDNYNNGSFRKYDYGPKKNMRLYGDENPPHYNLSAATAPTAFFLGPNDSIIQLTDIHESVSHIPNTVMIYQVPFSKFTHVDFIFARNATYLVYEPTYQLIRNVENGIVYPPIKIKPINNL